MAWTLDLRHDDPAHSNGAKSDGATSDGGTRDGGESKQDSTEKHWIERSAAAVSLHTEPWLAVALLVGILFLLAIACVIFVGVVMHTFDHPDKMTLAEFTANVINEILLVFIVVELVETAQHQIKNGISASLQGDLVRKVLIIGVLSSIRHLLSIGAELSTTPHSELDKGQKYAHVVQGLAVNALVVLVLVIGLILIARFFPMVQRSSSVTPSASAERVPS